MATTILFYIELQCGHSTTKVLDKQIKTWTLCCTMYNAWFWVHGRGDIFTIVNMIIKSLCGPLSSSMQQIFMIAFVEFFAAPPSPALL